MSKSKKGSRGKTVDLASFIGSTTDNLDWAQDEFAPTPPAGPDRGGEAPSPIDGKKGGEWRTFGFKAGNMKGNFREEAPVQLNTVVPEDMTAPFVAYVGNLPHNIAPSVVEEEFQEVIRVNVIKHDKSTFAYVEFESRDALQTAIFLTGKMVGGRKIKVDVASDAQRDRLDAERNKRSGSPGEFGRDSMGSAQPGRRGMGSRNSSSTDLVFSRDNMGAAQPSTDRVGTPTSTGSPLPELSREAFGASQQKSPNSGNAAVRPFRERSSKPASPVAMGTPNFRDAAKVPQPEPDFGGWRNTERVEQPTQSATVVAPVAPVTIARRPESEKPIAADDKPKQPEPKRTAPTENSWRKGPPAKEPVADRFAALRQ
jgi:RNA recognition motif-containing protein